MHVTKNLEPGEPSQDGKVMATVWNPPTEGTPDQQTSQQENVRTDGPNVLRVDKSQQTDPFQLEGRKLMVALRSKEECVTESSVQTELTMEALKNWESKDERRSRYQIEKQEKKTQSTVSQVKKEKSTDLKATKEIEGWKEWLSKPHTPPGQDTCLTDKGPQTSTQIHMTVPTASYQREQLDLTQHMPQQWLLGTGRLPSMSMPPPGQLPNVQQPPPTMWMPSPGHLPNVQQPPPMWAPPHGHFPYVQQPPPTMWMPSPGHLPNVQQPTQTMLMPPTGDVQQPTQTMLMPPTGDVQQPTQTMLMPPTGDVQQPPQMWTPSHPRPPL